MSSLDCLDTLPLYRGAVIVIGGEMAYSFSKRLRFFVQRLRPRLRVVVSTPERFLDPRAVNIFIPSWNREINSWIDKSGISGVVHARSAEHGDFTDAVSGEATSLRLPPVPKSVDALLQQLGYN
jgi:hypothetical protein